MSIQLSLQLQAYLCTIVGMALQAEVWGIELTDEVRARVWRDVWPIIEGLKEYENPYL